MSEAAINIKGNLSRIEFDEKEPISISLYNSPGFSDFEYFCLNYIVGKSRLANPKAVCRASSSLIEAIDDSNSRFFENAIAIRVIGNPTQQEFAWTCAIFASAVLDPQDKW